MRWRKVVLWVMVALFAWVLFKQFSSINQLQKTIRQGKPGWLFVALVCQILWFANITWLYRSVYRLLDLPAHFIHLFPLVQAGNFLNFTTPSASLGAVPLFLDDAKQRGLDAGRVTLINILRLVLNLCWFNLLLVWTLVMLWRWRHLEVYDVVAALILFTSTAVIIGSLVLAGTFRDRLTRFSIGGVRIVNRTFGFIVRRPLLVEEQALHFAEEFNLAARAVWDGKRRLLRPVLHTVLLDITQFGVLLATLQAFPGQSVALPMQVAIYSIAILFSVVAITPQGFGAVEGMMLGMLQGFGVGAIRSSVVVLVYRGITFFLPLLVGFIALRWVRGIGRPTLAQEAEQLEDQGRLDPAEREQWLAGGD
ncbi:MAG: hypothetical protein NVS4B8_00680 [Herpetosiphon sp.]